MANIKTTYDEAVLLHKDKFGYEPIIYGANWSEPKEWFIEEFLDAIDTNVPYIETDPETIGVEY
jgi:hypothetical protein